MARLPIPGADDGTWGDVLNDYLAVEHNSDGSLRRGPEITQAKNTADQAQAAVSAKADDAAVLHLAGAETVTGAKDFTGGITAGGKAIVVATDSRLGDASATNTGVIRLAGDLGGSATAPSIKNTTRVYNVKDYGAAGDGSTNDTAAIQSALNAAYTAGGGIVQVPQGTFIIDPNPGLQVKTNTILRGTGSGSIIKLANGSTHSDNMIKSESWTDVAIEHLMIDGNRANQAGGPGSYTHTQYGIYLGGTSNSTITDVHVKGTTGVGIHIYNSMNISVVSCYSTDNNYHGYELEQVTACRVTSSSGNNNLLHGILVSPGEVGGTGSQGNAVLGSTFDGNGNYGIATNAANGDISAFMSHGNMFIGNTVTRNAFYGVNFYKQNGHILSGNYIANNGFFGLYAFQSADNSIQNNTFMNNSQAGNGSYDEIMLEGYSTDNAHPSKDTIIAGNTILITGATKARYAIQESTTGDGPNTIYGNIIPTAGTTGAINIRNPDTVTYMENGSDQTINGTMTFAATVVANQGVEIAPNATLASGMGLDAPFGMTALRVYNNNTGGNVQLVAPNGNVDAYVGGNNTFSITGGETIAQTKFRIATSNPPASASDEGTPGMIAWDADYLYVCIANNTWKRTPLAAW